MLHHAIKFVSIFTSVMTCLTKLFCASQAKVYFHLLIVHLKGHMIYFPLSKHFFKTFSLKDANSLAQELSYGRAKNCLTSTQSKSIEARFSRQIQIHGMNHM
jgi:3-deoxy-D-manno-octulosonate 8-phosphate phosphatase KdsC-like HAD superfamily phosphatase